MNKLLHFWSSCTVFQLYEKSQAQLLKDLQVRLWFLIIREQKSLQVNHPLYHICIQVTADYSFVIIYPTELTNQYISAHKHYKFIGFSYVYLSWSLIPHAAFTYQKLDFDLKIRILDNETSSDSVFPQDIFTVRVHRSGRYPACVFTCP